MLKNNNKILQETKKNPLYSSNMCSQFLFLPSFLCTSFLMPEAPYAKLTLQPLVAYHFHLHLYKSATVLSNLRPKQPFLKKTAGGTTLTPCQIFINYKQI